MKALCQLLCAASLIGLFFTATSLAQRATTNVEYGALSAGGALLMDVYEPTTASASPRPLIIFVHGGGFTGGTRTQVARYVAAYTEAGFVLASIDYRLAREAPFPAAPMDVLTAVRYFRANAARWNIDANRIGLYGTSAGGHLAVFPAVAADTEMFETSVWGGYSSRVQAAASHFGPMDFVNNPPGGGELTFIGSATLAQASPVTYVDANDPPIFLAHGEQDPVVSIHHSELMFAALQNADVPSQFLRVANAGHGFVPTPAGSTISPSMTEIEAATIAFFKTHLVNASGGDGSTDTILPVVANVSVKDGATVIKRGRTATINWQSSDNVSVVSHTIQLSLDGGETFAITLADNLSGSASSFEWTVSNDLAKRKKAVIQIVARDAAGNRGHAASQTFKLK